MPPKLSPGSATKGRRYIEAVRPWELVKAERKEQTDSGVLDTVLAELVATCRDFATIFSRSCPPSPAVSLNRVAMAVRQ
ncbi:MAG: hypothetical protein ACRDTG_31550 [Pseudonocardiaceae bacterium]